MILKLIFKLMFIVLLISHSLAYATGENGWFKNLRVLRIYNFDGNKFLIQFNNWDIARHNPTRCQGFAMTDPVNTDIHERYYAAMYKNHPTALQLLITASQMDLRVNIRISDSTTECINVEGYYIPYLQYVELTNN